MHTIMRSHLVFVLNQCKYNISDGMHCVQGLQSIHVHQHNKLQIYSNTELQLLLLQLTTQPRPLNKLSSHPFKCNVPCKETAETYLFPCSFIVHATIPCFAPKWSNYKFYSKHNALSYVYYRHLAVLKSIMKYISFVHSLRYKFHCMMHQFPNSVQLHHAINIPMSYPSSLCIPTAIKSVLYIL